MQHYESAFRAFRSNEAIGLYKRVKVVAEGGEVRTEVAGVGDKDVGVQWEEAFESGDVRAVYLNSNAGTQKVVAAGSIDVGDEVYTAADGKVSDTHATNSTLRGIAIESAGADNDVIEIVPYLGDDAGA